MLKKYSILSGIVISIVLLLIAAMYYPGGSQYDKSSVGYDWKKNYLSNLFSEKAINGSDNSSRFWAIGGMFFLCISSAVFFVQFSKKIPSETAANVIKYFGVSAMLFAFLAVTPYHDTVITIASTLALVSMFYITVFVFKSKLRFFKILCVVCLLASYCCNYIYYTRIYIALLPGMQKISLLINIIWILGLEYFTKKEDFQLIKTVSTNCGKETANR